jgi:hypothetical protein
MFALNARVNWNSNNQWIRIQNVVLNVVLLAAKSKDQSLRVCAQGTQMAQD